MAGDTPKVENVQPQVPPVETGRPLEAGQKPRDSEVAEGRNRTEAVADLIKSLPEAEKKSILDELQKAVGGHADALGEIAKQKEALTAKVLAKLSVLNLAGSADERVVGVNPFLDQINELKQAADGLRNGTANPSTIEALLARLEATEKTALAQQEGAAAIARAHDQETTQLIIKGISKGLFS